MPLFWLSLAFVAGLVLGRGILYPAWAWGAAALAALGLATFERQFFSRLASFPLIGGLPRLRAFVRLPLAVLLAALLAGMARQSAARPELSPAAIAWYNGAGPARISGVVSEPPAASGRSLNVVVAVEQLTPLDGDGQPGAQRSVSGRLQAVVPASSPLRLGDRVTLDGPPVSPDSGDDGYAEYLAQQGISSLLAYPSVKITGHDAGSPLQAVLNDIRQSARDVIQQILPAPEAGLLTGILLGINSDLPAEVRQAFQDTGTAHIWAISGFNIAILAGLVLTLFGRLLPKKRMAPALLGAGAVALYTLLVGASPSVVRAAVMGTVGMFGPLLGRRQSGLNSLAFTAAVMALFEPLLPWNISFQLSFLATLGLVALGNPLASGLRGWLERRAGPTWGQRLAGPLGEYLLITLAAQAATLPVTAASFGRLSLSAVLANPLVLPIQPAVMILGGLALLGGMIFIPLGQALAALAWPALAYTIRAVEELAGLPGGVLGGQISPLAVAAWFAGLAALALGLQRLGGFARWLRPGLLVLGAALLAGTLWRGLALAPDGRLHLVAIESGGPPAVLLRTPGGEFVLINGGSQTGRLANELGRRLPPFSAQVAAWLVTAASPSPLEGLLDLSSQFMPRRVLLAQSLPASPTRTRLLEDLQQAGVETGGLAAGQTLELDGGVTLRVLADNKAGAAVLVEYGSLRALVPGGAPLKTLDAGDLAGVQVVILGPADLESQTAADWQALAPGLVAWTRLDLAQAPPGWESLAQRGWLEITSDGKQMWAEGGKK